MPSMTVTIGGVDRSASVVMSSVSIELNADRVGSNATFSMTDPSPRTGSTPIRPTERQAVTIVYDSITLFAGEISAIDTQYAPRELTYEITLQSYEAIFAATEIYATISYVGTSGQQNTAKQLRFTYDGDEAARIVNTYVSSSIAVTAAVGGAGKVQNLLTRAFRMARGTGASQRRVLDYKNGSVSDALDKIARVSGARWWIDGDKKLNWVKTRENLVGVYYDIESGSPLTTAASWVRTNSTGPLGTDDYALVTSTASTTGYFDVAATPGLRYYFGAHGRPTTASNLFVDILFLDAAKVTTLASKTITYATAATYAFKNDYETAPALTAYIRMRVRNGATATQSRVDNLFLLEESAGFGISDAPGSLEIAPEVYAAPSDFQSPCNQVRIKGKTTAGTGLRYEKFSSALYGTYAMTHEDAQSETSEDVDAAAKAIFDSRAFPQKRHAYRTRWSATTKVLKVGSYQILRFASINDLDIQRVQAIRYEWNSNDDCVMYVALGAPPGALGQGLARVGNGVYGPAGPQVGTSVAEVTSPKATISATVDTSLTKPSVTSLGSFGTGGGFRPASTSQRASAVATIDDTLPDLPVPELPPGSLYALFPAVADAVLTRAALYRVADDGLTWEAATSATLTADAVSAGTTGSVLIGEQIVAGTLDANSVNVTNLNATNITTGTLTSIAINSGTGRFTVDAAGNATANALIIGATTSDTVGNDTTGRIAIVPSSAQGAASFQVQVDTAGGLYTEIGINSATAGSSTADSTVTTDVAHGFVAGEFVSFHSTGNATWNAITASLPVQIKATPSSTTFTIRPSTALVLLASNNGGTARAYKRLNIVAPGGVFVYQSGTGTPTPGVLGTGSLVLGTTMTDLGEGGLATLADGEIGFLTATTPRYAGGANLYSSNGTSNVSTSGNFTVGGTMTAATISATNYGLTASDIPTLTLGTDTSGNYVSGLSAGTGVTVSGTAGEGWSPTVAIGQSVSTAATPTFAGITTTGNSTIGNSTGDQIKFTNLLQTSTITNSYSAIRLYNSIATVPWRAFVDSSSERFKSNIVYEDASDAILDLSSVSYHDKLEFEERGEEAPRQRGFLAEEVAANPDGETFVVFNADGEADAIQYDRLVVPLHSAMRKLRERIEELETRLASLEDKA